MIHIPSSSFPVNPLLLCPNYVLSFNVNDKKIILKGVQQQ